MTKSQVLAVLARALFQDKAVLEMATPLGCTHDAVQRYTAVLGAVTDFLLQFFSHSRFDSVTVTVLFKCVLLALSRIW